MATFRRLSALLAIGVATAATTAIANAAGYPERPLRSIIPGAGGGGPDVAARIVMAELST